MAIDGYRGPLRFSDAEINLKSTDIFIPLSALQESDFSSVRGCRPIEVRPDPFQALTEVTLAALEQGQTPEAFAARIEGPADLVDEFVTAYRSAYAKRYPR